MRRAHWTAVVVVLSTLFSRSTVAGELISEATNRRFADFVLLCVKSKAGHADFRLNAGSRGFRHDRENMWSLTSNSDVVTSLRQVGDGRCSCLLTFSTPDPVWVLDRYRQTIRRQGLGQPQEVKDANGKLAFRHVLRDREITAFTMENRGRDWIGLGAKTSTPCAATSD